MYLFWDCIIQFFDHWFFKFFGGLTATIAILTFLFGLIGRLYGVTPLAFRIANALYRRRIAILGDVAAQASMEEVLHDSDIFRKKNIVKIGLDNIDKVKDETILLVDWQSCAQHINEILAAKRHKTALIIFAKHQAIPVATMDTITNRSNTVIVNTRGRLLNDVLNALITTGV
jgi:hypothetical protein